jgi:hypothetical protein
VRVLPCCEDVRAVAYVSAYLDHDLALQFQLTLDECALIRVQWCPYCGARFEIAADEPAGR